MPRREQHVNNVATTLNGDITNSATSVVITSATGFPATGDYRILIDSEILLVTARSTTTLTCTRGVDGTTAASHTSGAAVTIVVTAASLEKMLSDAFSALAVPHRLLDQSGNTLTASSFTWLNQGTATATDDSNGGIVMTMPNEASHAIRGKYISAPSTPWTVTARIQFGPGYDSNGASGTYMGIFGRESSTGELYLLMARMQDVLQLIRYTNETTPSTVVDTALEFANDSIWLKLQDDGTNVRAYASFDGLNFYEAWNEGRTAFMAGGINQIGFFANSGGGAAGALFHFPAWVVE